MPHNCIILFKGRAHSISTGPSPGIIPLSLISLAAPLIKQGYDVKIIDAYFDNYDIAGDIWKNTILVGISALTGNEIRDGIEFAKIVRKNTKAPIIWGGWHASMLPEETLVNEYVDIVVLGAGQNTIVELADCARTTGNFKDVKGIYYKDGKKIIKTEDRDSNILRDSLPAFDKLDLERYRIESLQLRHGTNINDLNITGYLYYVSSFGCPNKCSYCCNSGMFKNKMLFYDTHLVIEQIKWLVEEKGFNSIGFMDANFFANIARVKMFCNEIVNRNIKFAWDAQMCVKDIIRYEKNDLLCLLRDAGCFRVNVGIESGSQDVLDYIKKDITVDEIIDSAKILKKYGFVAAYNLLFGLPLVENTKNIYKTFDLTRELKKINPDFSLPFSFYVPFPGTNMYSDAIKNGLQVPNKLEDWARLNIKYAIPNIFCGKSIKRMERLIYDVITFYLPLGFPGNMKRGTITNLAQEIKTSKYKYLIRIFSWVARKRAEKSFYLFRIEPFIFNWYNKLFNKNKYTPGNKMELENK